jgi:hypothetical protein
MPSSRPPEQGFSDSDQQWFDRLAGKPGPHSDERAVREADALKLALELEHERLEREGAAAAQDEEALERDWARLQAALEREGALQKQRRARWTWLALGGVAATVVLSAGLLRLWHDASDPAYGAPPVLRGTYPVRQMTTSAPREAAERFAGDLRRAGLAAAQYQHDKTFVVDVNLLPEQIEAARPAFARLDQAPTLGLTRVIFAPR